MVEEKLIMSEDRTSEYGTHLFNSRKKMERDGFHGFIAINELMRSNFRVPTKKGVYFVLNMKNDPPIFLEKNIGGHFKGKDPTVSRSTLNSKWVDNTTVIYIGQTGGGSSGATLIDRLQQLIQFGQGLPVGHWGGRYMWQLEDNRGHVVCWKILKDRDPQNIKKDLLKDFRNKYGKLPFANLRIR